MEDFEGLRNEVLADRDARCAYKENRLRRKLAAAFDEARQHRSLSIRGLAKLIGTSVSQVQRLLHREVGGSITLSTFVRAADALGLTLDMSAEPQLTWSAEILRQAACRQIADTVEPAGFATWIVDYNNPAISTGLADPALIALFRPRETRYQSCVAQPSPQREESLELQSMPS